MSAGDASERTEPARVSLRALLQSDRAHFDSRLADFVRICDAAFPIASERKSGTPRRRAARDHERVSHPPASVKA